ncbi:MAG: hypothetical protein Q8T08_22800, partial [Ignavibacteria bacterium]|nr:hypothetical protein [Ignavibacteria bacterium]
VREALMGLNTKYLSVALSVFLPNQFYGYQNDSLMLDMKSDTSISTFNEIEKVSSKFRDDSVEILKNNSNAITFSLSNNYFNVKRLEARIIEFQETLHIDETLDYIFDNIDDLLMGKQFHVVDLLLELVDPRIFTDEVNVGMLMITSHYKPNLPQRLTFYYRVHDQLMKKYNQSNVSKILDGLE